MKRDNNLAKTTHFPMGIEVDYADGIYIYDKQGNKYIDLISGIAVSNLAHNNKDIISAVKAQVDRYMHVMVYGEYKQDVQEELVSLLCSFLPNKLNSVYLLNSGTEANEVALKLAKRITGRTEIVSFNASYHGSTHGSLSVSGNEYKKQAFRPLLPGIKFIDFNDINLLDVIDNNTACVIIEPIQGDAGIRIPSKEFMLALRKRCDETATFLIFDEIQTAFGRTGKLFAFEHFDVVPDILTIAKSFGGGLPLAGVVSSKENLDKFTYNPELGHITTFGGNPVSCASALAHLKIVSDKKILSKIENKGKLFEKHLNSKNIIEIRRIGLFFAIQMQSKEIVSRVVQDCKQKGLLSFWFLSCPDSFRIAPPLIINEEDIIKSCKIINDVLDSL